jgi:hypothetical protein
VSSVRTAHGGDGDAWVLTRISSDIGLRVKCGVGGAGDKETKGGQSSQRSAGSRSFMGVDTLYV